MTLGIGVMTRAPSSGGKSRLASHLSDLRLCALRQALMVDTIETLEAVPDVAAVLFFTPAEGEAEIRALSPPAWRCVAQAGGDLGERMRAALAYLLQAPRCEAAVLVGTDMPLLAADRAGIEARLNRAAYDVDTIDDLHRLERDLQAAPPHLAPRVRAWFSERS